MPLLPIDLQTVFAQMANVGKEQAALREVPPQYQALMGSELAQQTRQSDSSVPQRAQVGANSVPQMAQNLAPGAFCRAHAGHLMPVPASIRRSSVTLTCRFLVPVRHLAALL